MRILDLSAGNRAIWFDKNHPLALFIDKRPEVKPDIIADTTQLPDSVGYGYDLVVFDPPHLNTGKNSNMSKTYGHFTTEEILNTIKGTAKEAHRVTRSNALMALKWNTHDIKLERVFKLMPQWEPLFGHLTKDGPRSQTYWVMLKRINPTEESENVKTKRRKQMSKKLIPCLITTDQSKRGVFMGYIKPEDADKETLEAQELRMVVYWSADVKGVIGLAASGPTKSCRVTKAAKRAVIKGVTAVIECTDEAVKAFEKEPWG